MRISIIIVSIISFVPIRQFIIARYYFYSRSYYVEESFTEYNSKINGSGGLDKHTDDYEGWLDKLERDRNLPYSEDIVPALTYFLVRESDNKIIGMVNIRLMLNKKLRESGGHIGYGIRPTERRKG